MRCLAKQPEGRPSSMDEVILMLKQATGLSLTTSGQFALSQELRLGSPLLTQSGRMPTGTPSQAYLAGAAGVHGLSPNTLSGEVLTHTGALPGVSQLPASLSQPPQAANTWLPRIVVVAAVLIAGGFLALRFAEQPAAPTSLQPNGAQEAASPVSPGAPSGTNAEQAPTAVQQHVVVTVTSNPPGALVSVDGKVYGETPADIEWWGEQAAPGREVSFVLTKDGFEKATVVRSIVGDRLTVDAHLARIPSSAPVRPRAPREPRNSPAPVVMPDNFKDDPY
jgi:hypothetical protein